MTCLCPKCKGRKVVFNPLSIMLTIMLPVAMLVESDDKHGDNSITKKECPTCNGKGFLKFE